MTADDIRQSKGEGASQCPVTPLGHNGGRVYVLTAHGDILDYRPRDLGRPEIEFIFGDNANWLFHAFPKTDDKGNRTGINWSEARYYLVNECGRAGFFDKENGLRGPGIWRNPGGPLIVHAGDAVEMNGRWQRAGFKAEDGFIYMAGPREPRPADEPAPAWIGRELRGFLEAWNWLAPPVGDGSMGARLCLGWLANACIVGALKWRPHILITGERGTGKSSLDDLIEAILNPRVIMKASAPSAAGVRQQLAGAARPVMLDEVEHSAENRHASQLIEMARLGSTDGQGAVTRGSKDGRPQAWHIRACFVFSAILHPKLQPQDASRITVLDLGPLNPDPEAGNRITEGIEYFATWSGAIRRRMIALFGVYEQNREVFRTAVIEAGGDSRQADQFGALLAGAHTLEHDEAVNAEDATDLAKRLIKSELVPDEGDSDAAQCLERLLTWPVDLPQNGARRRFALGTLIRSQRDQKTRERADLLASYGVKVRTNLPGQKGDPGHPGFLVVANNHTALERVYEGTRWQRGVWPQALGRLPLCHRGKVCSFAGSIHRAVWIPLEKVFDPDAEEDERAEMAAAHAEEDGAGAQDEQGR